MAVKQSVEWNHFKWDVEYPWIDGGDNWSTAWGGPDKQWDGTILPRIRKFLPVHTCLEIAPGFGRWTQFLQAFCDRLIIVEISKRCISACQQRFADSRHINYFVNDGRSLAMVPDDSVDFVFSFDSLVHVESDVIEAYLQQLAAKLTKDGIGFLHHSNLGQYRAQLWYLRIPLVRGLLSRAGLQDLTENARALSMTAGRFEEIAGSAGLQCISQELINWSSPRLSDCLSIIAHRDGRWSASNEVRQNPRFMEEARQIREGR